ncbi:Relaxase/Mobilisation nuclease domain-containing protein [Algoriphagus locisalis]|uniref:Relaxase/Mobilisation nuclease domain-containing protein n=1 Tax=Algoriphagus locisalis TaxID=305507 RepID=A0A1I7A9I4_9BACT|nr:relaxase/mobilization nuclease domain-containing protein [Algoriphagus locisalis]SFT71567.1 Relaxase/Mobilisation nuclease domain-containing protein [Algoriphagus locisalis]
MRAKILSSTSSFKGVTYNTNKTQNEKGELMRLRNFGYLQDTKEIGPNEVKNFLIAHSNRNSIVRDKQFHAMISCKEREYTKEELTDIAHEWVDKMGYGKNPFLIVFHKDTANNHVHIVSSRIDKEGRKINDSFERIRAQEAINEIMRLNPKQEANKASDTLREFSFSTKAQGMLLLENLGYKLKEKDQQLILIKYGSVQGRIPISEINQNLQSYELDNTRANQLKAILDKYSRIYKTDPTPLFEPKYRSKSNKHIGYRSDLGDFLSAKFGVQLIFHGKDAKTPYGFSLIDSSNKNVFKGSEVFPIKRLLEAEGKQQPYHTDKSKTIDFIGGKVKLRSAFNDFSTIRQGLEHHSLRFELREGWTYLRTSQGAVSTKDILQPNQQQALEDYLDLSEEHSLGQDQDEFDLIPILHAANDEDDEAIHGRKRRKKRRGDNEITR